jgi:hypothetical protein
MCAIPWYYVRNQVIEENASSNLFPCLGPHFHEGTSKHLIFNNAIVTVFNKDRHTAKVNILKVMKTGKLSKGYTKLLTVNNLIASFLNICLGKI